MWNCLILSLLRMYFKMQVWFINLYLEYTCVCVGPAFPFDVRKNLQISIISWSSWLVDDNIFSHLYTICGRVFDLPRNWQCEAGIVYFFQLSNEIEFILAKSQTLATFKVFNTRFKYFWRISNLKKNIKWFLTLVTV